MSAPMTRAKKFCERIEAAAIKNACWTCECLQGLILHLLNDLKGEDVAELKKLWKDERFLHSCLGCDPCPPGKLFTDYLKKKK